GQRRQRRRAREPRVRGERRHEADRRARAHELRRGEGRDRGRRAGQPHRSTRQDRAGRRGRRLPGREGRTVRHERRRAERAAGAPADPRAQPLHRRARRRRCRRAGGRDVRRGDGQGRVPGLERSGEPGTRGGAVSRAWVQTADTRRACVALLVLAFGGCGAEEAPPEPDVRPVRTITVEELPGGEQVTLTGRIEAQEEVSLAFRVSQRLIERRVNVGDRVEAGQLVARIEATTLDNAVQAARANLAAAQAAAADARLEFDRQRSLFERGVAPRARFERAQAAREAAAAQVDAAQAQLATAREQRSYTELFADAPGTVTAVGAEPGEVVAAGQMIVRAARQDGRDAVFGVRARVKEAAGGLDPEVTVALASDPSVTTTGRVREVSPQADPVTRTFAVRVGLADPP